MVLHQRQQLSHGLLMASNCSCSFNTCGSHQLLLIIDNNSITEPHFNIFIHLPAHSLHYFFLCNMIPVHGSFYAKRKRGIYAYYIIQMFCCRFQILMRLP